mgnify:CR=1 FL=1
MKTGDKKRLLLLLWLQKEMLEVLKISQKSLLWCKDQEGTTKSMKEIKTEDSSIWLIVSKNLGS